MKTKRGPLPTWAWLTLAAAGLLALRWWRNRSPAGGAATVTAPAAGIQPLVGAGSPTMVSTPAGNGVGSPTVAGASRIGIAGDARSGGPPHTEPVGTILGYGETAYAASYEELKGRQPSWGASAFSGPGQYRVVYRVGTNGFKDTVWERV